MRSIKDVDVKNKKILLRVDLNVPVGEDSRIDNDKDWKIQASLPTIRYLKERGAEPLLMTHLGRPQQDNYKKNFNLDPVRERLKDLLGFEVKILENLRLNPQEENNSREFAKELASQGDIYVNDAFSASHRAHASLVSITEFLPSYCGLLLEKEVLALERITSHIEHPLAVVIGGAKIETKYKVLKRFLQDADSLILGGMIANAVLAAKGIAIGKSYVDGIGKVEDEFKDFDLTSPKLHLPVDVIVGNDLKDEAERISSVGNIKGDELIFDIGPDTIELFRNVILEAKTLFWNGPMGLAENPSFAIGTKSVADAIAKSKAFSVVGGGETVMFVMKMGLQSKISHLSTGGGALLSFLAGDKLPGLEALGYYSS